VTPSRLFATPSRLFATPSRRLTGQSHQARQDRFMPPPNCADGYHWARLAWASRRWILRGRLLPARFQPGMWCGKPGRPGSGSWPGGQDSATHRRRANP